jgi:hypothetical protein
MGRMVAALSVPVMCRTIRVSSPFAEVSVAMQSPYFYHSCRSFNGCGTPLSE